MQNKKQMTAVLYFNKKSEEFKTNQKDNKNLNEIWLK